MRTRGERRTAWIVALRIFGESAQRLASPVTIPFDEAIAVACVGLAVNVICALLLVADLHVWRVRPRHLAHYKCVVARQSDLVHMTVEVHRRPDGAGIAA